MSAQTSYFTVRDILFFVLFVAVFSFLLPQTVSADTLPDGVTERQTCGATTLDIYAYGAGLMHSSSQIVAENPHVSYISPTENCAVVEWNTKNTAATQVLFAELSGEPVSIDLTAENFGYPYATTQNNAGIAHHVAILTNLQPGTAYSYRLVSRSHPTALPSISDARVLIAGPAIGTYTQPPVVTVTPTAPTVPSTPTMPTFDAEKFPIAPAVTQPVTTPDTETDASTTDATNTVPSALNAVTSALGTHSKEGTLWGSIKHFFSNFHANKGFFATDRYIVPALFFIVLLFLLQQLVLPAFSVNMKNPLLYWLVGSLLLAVLSAAFMFYYIALIAIALFLGVLAWYLLESIPESDDAKSSQTKLLGTSSNTTETTKNSSTTTSE